MSSIISNKAIREKVFNMFDGKCSYCGIQLNNSNFQVDHINPLRRKMSNCEHGKDSIDNFMPSCAPCNYSKSSMDLERWRLELNKKLHRLSRDSSTYRLALRFNMITENVTESIVFYFEKHNYINNG